MKRQQFHCRCEDCNIVGTYDSPLILHRLARPEVDSIQGFAQTVLMRCLCGECVKVRTAKSFRAAAGIA